MGRYPDTVIDPSLFRSLLSCMTNTDTRCFSNKGNRNDKCTKPLKTNAKRVKNRTREKSYHSLVADYTVCFAS